jgi:hypothetical protein
MHVLRPGFVGTIASACVLVVIACGSDGSSSSSSGGALPDSGTRGIEPAGQTCTAAAQCYPALDGGGLAGEVTCLTKVSGGYCTHVCTQDSDCCATPGECLTGVTEVCSPLENQGAKYCFLSCEDADVQRALAANADAGVTAGGGTDAFCHTFAGTATGCRSSGGGSKNRKICLP